MAGYTVYEEHPLHLAAMQPPRNTCSKMCYRFTCSLFTYFLVMYVSANTALLACFKTNCTLPHNFNFTEINGTSIVINNARIEEFLEVTDSIAGFLLLMFIFCNTVRCLNGTNY